VSGAPRPIAILIAALGGQGGGVLAEWLVEAATRAGYPAQSTSIPGVAQRTGATTYYVEVFPVPASELAGRRPVLSLLPVPGCIDLLAASELLEAGRAVHNGMVSADRSVVVTSSARTLTTAEKIGQGDGRFDSARLLEVAATHSRRLVAFDMDAAARDAQTAVSAVMLGAIAATGVLPLDRAAFEAAVRDSALGVAASLAGFGAGWQAVVGADAAARDAGLPASPVTASAVPPAVAAALPPAAHEFAAEGYRRLAEFQDAAYADLYVQRLVSIRAAEEASDPGHAHGHAVTRETARFLALWMAFDDIVRVADLKCRRSRFARVRREVAATDADVVRIVDYFKPGAGEFAALLPPVLARRLLAWDRRRQSRGKEALALALHVRTDGILGFLALRALASLRSWRRRGARFGEEQAAIARWLQAIQGALRDDWQCGCEVALCGRLVKGYGATNERGKRNLVHILDHLVARPFASAAARADAIRQARDAALADEEGRGLDAALARHGAPPLPIAAQPIRWVKKRAAEPAAVTR
jgi:indolepyruvate ferredoxin oxidoreductase beta subunit